jgi:hypothetical protein
VINPVTSVVIPAMMANVEEVEVVVAHNEREDPGQSAGDIGTRRTTRVEGAPGPGLRRCRRARLAGQQRGEPGRVVADASAGQAVDAPSRSLGGGYGFGVGYKITRVN